MPSLQQVLMFFAKTLTTGAEVLCIFGPLPVQWGAIEHASLNLRGDRELMLPVVEQGIGWLKHASSELRADREFVLHALRKTGLMRSDDADETFWCSHQYGHDLLYASSELREDREFVLEAVREVGGALQHAPEDMQKDLDFVAKAVRQNHGALKYVSKELRHHPLVFQAAITERVHGELGSMVSYAIRRTVEQLEQIDSYRDPTKPDELSFDFKNSTHRAVLDDLCSDRGSEIQKLRSENARLNALRAVDVIDCTGPTVITTNEPPPASGLKAMADAVAAVDAPKIKRERDAHESRAELLDTMVLPLEEQRRQLQALVTEAATALIEADVPTVKLSDEQMPFYYSSNSWEDAEEVPWNPETGAPMTLAEGIRWIQRNNQKPKKRARRS